MDKFKAKESLYSAGEEVSECCNIRVVEDFRMINGDHHDIIEIYRCSLCNNECQVLDLSDVIAKDSVDLDLHNKKYGY